MRDVIRHTTILVIAAGRVGIGLLRDAAALLATAPDPTAEEDRLSSAVRGGELNYRTGGFDDGTDAAGWYDHD